MNVKLGSGDGFERRNWECDSDGSERQNWKCDEDGFERWYWEVMALNAELKVWHGDSECRKPWMNGGPKRRMKQNMTLNAEWRCNDSEC